MSQAQETELGMKNLNTTLTHSYIFRSKKSFFIHKKMLNFVIYKTHFILWNPISFCLHCRISGQGEPANQWLRQVPWLLKYQIYMEPLIGRSPYLYSPLVILYLCLVAEKIEDQNRLCKSFDFILWVCSSACF